MRTGIGIYIKNSIEAVELYKKAFGLELGYHEFNPDGSYYHSELYRDGQEIFDVIESRDDVPHTERNVQIAMIMDSEEQVRAAFAQLSEGGQTDGPPAPLPWSPCAATLRDRFGVWWYICAPQHMPPADFDPAAEWTPDMYKQPE